MWEGGTKMIGERRGQLGWIIDKRENGFVPMWPQRQVSREMQGRQGTMQGLCHTSLSQSVFVGKRLMILEVGGS